MEELLVYLLGIVITLLIVWMVFGVFHLMLQHFDWYDRIAINIKLPKRKRFKTKATPIYQLEKSDLSGSYFIRKWELDYAGEFGLQLLMIFIPYPINLFRYKYVMTGYVDLDGINIKDITEDIGDMFERLWAIENAAEIELERKRKEYQDNLDRINKVFNENFEE